MTPFEWIFWPIWIPLVWFNRDDRLLFRLNERFVNWSYEILKAMPR